MLIQELHNIFIRMPKKSVYKGAPPIKKTGYINQKKLAYDQRFDGVNTTPLIAGQHAKIKERFARLSKLLLKHAIIWSKAYENELSNMKNYIQCYHQYYEYDQYDSQFSLLPSLDVNLYTVSNQQLIYKSLNIFKNSLWPIRFSSKFTARLKDYSISQIFYILSFVALIGQGNYYGKFSLKKNETGQYGYVQPIQYRFIPYNRFFTMKIFRQKNVIFNVGVEKIPIVKGGVIKRYEFLNYVQFLDILSDQIAENPKKMHETIDRFAKAILQDVAKRDHSDELIVQQPNKGKKKIIQEMFEQSINPYTGLSQIFERQINKDHQYNFKPFIFKPHYVSINENSTLIFNKEMKRWISSDHLTKMEKKALNQYQKRVNDEMIKRFLDFQSAKTLVQLLTKIPNFRVELTQQEKDVIGQNGNVLVIGRSGTGKTTCAVLRLFAIEMLFKIRLSLFKKKFQSSLKDTRCSADDIDDNMGLHCIFLTASPVLINEIQRYYRKLTDNIKLELEKKRKRVAQQNKKQRQAQNQNSQQMKKKQETPQFQTKVQAQQSYQQIKTEQQSMQKQEQQIQAPQSLLYKKSVQLQQQQDQMNQKLGDITLGEDSGALKNTGKQNEGAFKEPEEDEDEVLDDMKNQLQNKMRNFKSLQDLNEQDYPGFFTVKSFIMMLDATLKKPFFIRKKQQNTEKQSQANWHNQKKGVMMIQNYYRNDDDNDESKADILEQIEEQINYSDEEQLEHEYMRQIQLRENRQKQKVTEKLNKNKKALSFQVDYDYFYSYFWPTVKHRHFSARNITPHLVWTEIFSTIKGGASSHLYPGLNLSQTAYIKQSTNCFLSKQEKLDIFETYCQYERWKIRTGGYDIMDAVNYILNIIRFKGYDGPDIHYIMIDQVQDLPHAIIYLLSKTVKYGVFYSGDTAQTIAKGIGFRFCDLKNLFDPRQFDSSLTLSRPVVKQLTVNFRSHNNILQLANSVVSSIQILFPKTIDRLNKQVSNIKGPKPMILAENDQELLFYVLCGDQSYKTTMASQQQQVLKKPPLEFGCDQVIIVRDQQSKNRIPTMLQHALCLTIYEAKGLQFNDVILFNFFTESKCADKWNLLKFLKVIIKNMDKQQYQRSVTKHETTKKTTKKDKGMQQGQSQQQQQQQQQQQNDQQVDCIVDQDANTTTVNIKKIVSDSKIYMKDINDYAELCSELKMLYTAITRPRKTLVIYDEDAGARKPIEKLWQKLDVVELISKQLLDNTVTKANRNNHKQTEQIKIFRSIVNSTNNGQWKKQGLRMYGRGYFQQAMKCFERSGDKQLLLKAQANMIADNASKKLIDIQSERSAIKNHLIQYQKMNQSQISKIKKRLKKQQSNCYTQFTKAGAFFEDLKLFKQAGQCYFSGKIFHKSFQNFSKAQMHRQAAQSLEMLNKYREAAQYYDKDGNYLKIIQCYDMLNEWQNILIVIQKFASEMTQIQKQSLLKKYSALALQQLVYEIQFQNQLQGDEKINGNNNNRIQIIKQEEDSQQEEDWDQDQDPQIAAEKAMRKKSMFSDSDKSDNLENRRKFSQPDSQLSSAQRKISAVISQPKRKQSLIQSDKIIQQSVYQHIQQKQPQQQQPQLANKQSDDSSFADLNQQQQHSQSQSANIMQSVYQQIPKVIPQQQQQQQQQKIQGQKLLQPQQKVQVKNIDAENSNSFVNLNNQSQQVSQSSFGQLNSLYSQSLVEQNIRYPSQLQPDIESIRSMADLQDSWIRSALSEIQAKTNTEYSIIDEQQNYNPNVRIIKTKGNIFVQDQIMRKIVSIVSIINTSVQQFFKQFKGYQSLITISNQKSNEDIIDNRPEISEFEDIDPKFINIILDTLQSFKLHKLCLFVCNRYHMPHKAGRYLVSMALRYSTNATINNTLNPSLISPSIHRKSELEKGILASIALHAIFENVSADFLKVKVSQKQNTQEGKNTLGSYFIEGLLLEGIYKKAVFMVNPEESLKLLYNYSDFGIYQEVFKQKFLKKQLQKKLDFLAQPPKTAIQDQFTVMKLQSMMFDYNCINKVDFVSQRFYRQFNITEIKLKFKPQILPEYTPYLKSLMNQNQQQILQCVHNNISQAYSALLHGPDYKIYDVTCFLLSIISKQHLSTSIYKLNHTDFMQVYRCLKYLKNTLYSISLNKNSFTILQAIFSYYGCRLIKPCKSMKFIHDGYSLVKRTTVLCNYFVEQIKKRPEQCAYFVEQDYNLIVVRTMKLIEVVRKKYQMTYAKFIRIRSLYQQHIQRSSIYTHQGFVQLQTEQCIKMLMREEDKLITTKKSKKTIRGRQHHQIKKKIKPNFNYRAQGRPQLAIDLYSDSQNQNDEQQQYQQKQYHINTKFIFPDLHPKLQYFHDTVFSLFNQKARGSKSCISGKLLFCSGLNDAYKQYTKHMGGYNLYDAIQFKKFKRIDLYIDNIMSIISDLSYSEKPIIIGEMLILLLVQYRLILSKNKQCKIDISRDFLRFLPKLQLIEAIINPNIFAEEKPTLQQMLESNSHTCIFKYENIYCNELSAEQITEIMCELLDVMRIDQSYKNFSLQNLIIIFFLNTPVTADKQIFQTLRITINSLANQWTNLLFQDFKHSSNPIKSTQQFLKRRESIINAENGQYIKKCVVLHQVRIKDVSNLDKAIKDSERDYEIKQKILDARKKAAVKISQWWKIIKKKPKPADQQDILIENKIVKCTYNIKYLPYDDRFLVRSAQVRNTLFCFYLSKVVTSSLDFHFILMTLNKIQQLRQKYLKAYSQALTEIQDTQIDYEIEVSNIQSAIDIWRKDSKWLKDRNMDLKRKKVFEVKWMTKNNIHSKIIKKRAGLKKQKNLQDKKKILKRLQK